MPVTYCSEIDLTDRYGTDDIAELTGDETGVAVDSAKVAKAIDQFAERMNASIRKQYPDLPFDATHVYLNGLNTEGAYLLLIKWSDRGWDEDDRSDWKTLLKDLEHLARGVTDLRTETDIQAEDATDPYFSSEKRVFGRSRSLSDAS